MTMTAEQRAQLRYEPKFSRLWDRFDEADHGSATHMREILGVALGQLDTAERNIAALLDELERKDKRIAELESNQTTETGQQIIIEAIGAHGYIVGCLLQGRPDLALAESRKWVEAFGLAALTMEG